MCRIYTGVQELHAVNYLLCQPHALGHAYEYIYITSLSRAVQR